MNRHRPRTLLVAAPRGFLFAVAASVLLLGGAIAARAVEAAGEAPEPLDPFVVAIDIERSTVLLRRASDGLTLGPPAMIAPDFDDFEARAAAASHEALWQLVVLRRRMCAIDLVGSDHCGAFDMPAWAGEPIGAPVGLSELKSRGDWIAETMAPFVDAGCQAGRIATEDELYCSVE